VRSHSEGMSFWRYFPSISGRREHSGARPGNIEGLIPKMPQLEIGRINRKRRFAASNSRNELFRDLWH
jgi:hypothetical protein